MKKMKGEERYVCYFSGVRGFLARRSIGILHKSVIAIQRLVRGHLQRVSYKQLVEEHRRRKTMLLMATGQSNSCRVLLHETCSSKSYWSTSKDLELTVHSELRLLVCDDMMLSVLLYCSRKPFHRRSKQTTFGGHRRSQAARRRSDLAEELSNVDGTSSPDSSPARHCRNFTVDEHHRISTTSLRRLCLAIYRHNTITHCNLEDVRKTLL